MEWSAEDECGPNPADPFSPTHIRGCYPVYIHWQHPFGVYNAMNEGGCTDLDEYLASGNVVGLRQIDNLFPELEEGA